MRTDTAGLASVRVNEWTEPCLYSALPDDLPGTMPVDAEEKPLVASHDASALIQVLLDHQRGLLVDWENTPTPVLKLFGDDLDYPLAAFLTELTGPAEVAAAPGARQVQARLEMLNRNFPSLEVDVVNSDREALGDATAEAIEKAHQKPVPQRGCGIFKALDFGRLKVCFRGPLPDQVSAALPVRDPWPGQAFAGRRAR